MFEIIVKNYRRSRKFGWGYSFTPTGEDAYSIKTPAAPDHTGTLSQIADAIQHDRTWQAKGGAFYNTAWFHDGRRITATWAFTKIGQGKYDWAWVTGWEPPFDDERDVKIQVE